MTTRASLLIKGYFHQLTKGCGDSRCQEPECCSCFRFSHHFPTPNDAAYLAIQLALDHPYHNHLCQTVQRSIRMNSILNELTPIDEMIRKMIHQTHKKENNSTINSAMKKMFMYKFYCYILLSNQEPLSMANISINDEEMSDFFRTMPELGRVFNSFKNDFSRLTSEIMREREISFYHVRGMIIVLSMNIFYDIKTFETIYVPLLAHLLSFSKRDKNYFFDSLQELPRMLAIINEICQNNITKYIIKHKNKVNPDVLKIVADFINLLRNSSLSSPYPCPSKTFSNAVFTSKIADPKDEANNFINGRKTILQTPAILDLSFKNAVFHLIQDYRQQVTTRQALGIAIEQHGFLDVILRQVPQNELKLYINVRRNNLIQDTINNVTQIPPDHLTRKLVVEFQNEEAYDVGGVSREFFHLVISQIFSPDYGMFRFLNGKYYWFTFNSNHSDLIYYSAMGTLVGLAVYNNLTLPIRFPLLLYKKILNRKITLNDMIELDPEIVRSFNLMKDMKKKGNDVTDLCLTFSTTIEVFGEPKEIPIIDGGGDIEVNNDNLDAYIYSYVDWYTNVSIDYPFQAFSDGFLKVCPLNYIQFFSADELDVLVSGEINYDWDALKRNVVYLDGYKPYSNAVKMFWEIFDSFNNEMKCKFLQFTTGSDRAPIGGLQKVNISIQKLTDTSKLPISHTCFNIFGLPEYKSKQEMEKKIRIALEHSEGFGFL